MAKERDRGETGRQREKERTFIICGCTSSGKSQLREALLGSKTNSFTVTNRNWDEEENALAHIGVEFDQTSYSFSKSQRSSLKSANASRKSSQEAELGSAELAKAPSSEALQTLTVRLTVYESMGDIQFQTVAPAQLLNRDNIHSTAVVVVIDLTTPLASFTLSETILNQVRSATIGIMAKLDERNSDRPKQLRKRSEQKYGGSTHPDWQVILEKSIISIPVLLVASKLDLVAKYSPSQIELVMTAFRYLAHVYGASFIVDNLSDPKSCSSTTLFAKQVNNIGDSGAALKKKFTIGKAGGDTSDQCFCVPAGKDSLKDIESCIPKLIQDGSNFEASLSQLEQALAKAF